MDASETRQRILEAADGLFGELGFDVTTTRDIAERSGVNKALIHCHFGTKDDLLEALLDGYYGATISTSLRCWPARTTRSRWASMSELATGKPSWRSIAVVLYLLKVSAMFSTPPVW